MVETGDKLNKLHAALFSSYFVISMTTIVWFFFKTFYSWLKQLLHYPTKHILADREDIKSTPIDSKLDTFDPIAEAEYLIEKMNQEPSKSEDFAFDAHHSKTIIERKWEKKFLKRIGTKEENSNTDFHF